MTAPHESRRLALVLIDLASHGQARCGHGFGKYPLGVRDALAMLRPLVQSDDPDVVYLDAAILSFNRRLETE